jgi:predicted lactoylglutathione lyase
MSTTLAVNLSVKDLARSTRFIAELGFAFDERLADEHMNALVVNDGTYVLVVASSFKAATNKGHPRHRHHHQQREILQLGVDSRQRVDELVDKAFAAGGQPGERAQRPELPLWAELPGSRQTLLGRVLLGSRRAAGAGMIRAPVDGVVAGSGPGRRTGEATYDAVAKRGNLLVRRWPPPLPGSAAEGAPGPRIRVKPQVRRMEPGENRRIA